MDNMFDEVRELIPVLPWCTERYGFSLAQIRDGDGRIVIDQLNVAIAEYIVKAVNQCGPVL